MNKQLSIFKGRNIAMMFAAVAALCVMSQEASAQHFGHGHGGHGRGISIGHGGVSIGGGGYGRGIGIGQGVYSRGVPSRGISIGIGNFGGYGGGYGYNSFRPTYRAYRAPFYHDTTHLDYHRPRIVPHGNHYDYIPGHYDVHRTGHWHR